MGKPKLPRIDVRLDELAEVSKNAEDYGEIVNVVVDEVVQKATKPLDNVMEQIQELLKDVQSMSTEDLNYFTYRPLCISLRIEPNSSVLRWTQVLRYVAKNMTTCTLLLQGKLSRTKSPRHANW